MCDTTIIIPKPNCGCQAIADTGPDQILDCLNTTTTLGGDDTSVGSIYLYEWYDEDGTLVSNEISFTTSMAGTYTFIVYDIDEQCEASATVLVTDISNNPIANIIANPGEIIDCVIDTVTLGYVEEMDVVYTWVLDGVEYSLDSLIITQTSEVTLTAYDTVTHCMTEAIILIEDQEDYPLILIEDPDTLNCIVDMVTIDASNSQSGPNISYQWYDSDGVAIEGAVGNALDVTEPGIYFFEATDFVLGCDNIDSVEVIGDYMEPELNTDDDAFLPCDDTILMLDAMLIGDPEDFNYQWSTIDGNIESGANTSNPEVTETGWYYVTVTGINNGCNSEDSIYVDVNDLPEGFDSLIDPPLCAGINDGTLSVSVSSGGTAPFTYTLGDQSNSTGQFENLGAGMYTVEVEDALGCSYSTSFEIEEPAGIFVDAQQNYFEVQYNDGVTIILDTNVDPSNIDQIIWDPPLDFECPNCLTIPLDSLTESQTYLITLIDENGCIDTTTLRVEVDREIDIYIPNVFDPNQGDENGTFFPQTKDDDIEVLDMYIYDRWGELVYHNSNFFTNQAAEGWDGTFNGKDAASGVYVYYFKFDAPGVGELKKAGDITLIR